VSKERKTQTLSTPQRTKKGVNGKMAGKQDVIFVGNKPPMSYVLAIITAFSASNSKAITLKARGQAITTAVDVAEITRSRFLKDLKVSKIAIGTQEMPPREGENRSRMVSTIEIALSKE
jgi:DNA-binding protein